MVALSREKEKKKKRKVFTGKRDFEFSGFPKNQWISKEIRDVFGDFEKMVK